MTRAGEPADPTRDYLHWRNFETLPDGSKINTPMSLSQVEQVWREIVDGDGGHRVRLRLENSDEEEVATAPSSPSRRAKERC